MKLDIKKESDFLRVQISGTLTLADLETLGVEVSEALDSNPIKKILYDPRLVEIPKTEVSRAAVDKLRQLEQRVDKLAMVYADLKRAVLARFVLRMSGIKNGRTFTDEKTAIAWLQE